MSEFCARVDYRRWDWLADLCRRAPVAKVFNNFARPLFNPELPMRRPFSFIRYDYIIPLPILTIIPACVPGSDN
ncbi:hypothetical protein DFH07DRAFT_962674 [Mycena maculata]|uniref:Uncharacterized protein n=1 Tax=Mycena maculata TaxID=230809 RepID=A0AAD7IR49_9AGAR|nr:hypothetical protein DFH07DRAFT_962674 [Mycena maculata]